MRTRERQLIAAALFGLAGVVSTARAQPAKAMPMASPVPATGAWTLAADTALLVGLKMRVVEVGSTMRGTWVRGVWSAPRLSCEPSGSASCMMQGDVLGSREGAVFSVELLPSVSGGLGAHLELTMTDAATMTGNVTLGTAGKTLALSRISLARVSQ